MAHVILRVGDATTNGRNAELILNGREIADDVIADSVRIQPRDGAWAVTFSVVVTSLDAEIPDCEITATEEIS